MIVDDHVDAAETLNTDFAKMHDWSMKWLVKFNPDKTESMIVSRKSNRPLHPPLMMDNKIRVITKLLNSEQFYKGKVKTHNYINRQNQSTTGKL